jgi:hypothetical protein
VHRTNQRRSTGERDREVTHGSAVLDILLAEPVLADSVDLTSAPSSVLRRTEVHHLRPLAGLKKEYRVNPVKDLRPVCPNCHAMLHLGNQLRSIDEVKQLLAKSNRA